MKKPLLDTLLATQVYMHTLHGVCGCCVDVMYMCAHCVRAVPTELPFVLNEQLNAACLGVAAIVAVDCVVMGVVVVVRSYS